MPYAHKWPSKHDLLHQMKPFTKSMLQKAHDRFRNEFEATANHPFRDKRDVWALWLATVLCVEESQCSVDYNVPRSQFIILPGAGVSREFQRIDSFRPTLFCVNDSDASTAGQFESELARHFPDRSFFEK